MDMQQKSPYIGSYLIKIFFKYVQQNNAESMYEQYSYCSFGCEI